MSSADNAPLTTPRSDGRPPPRHCAPENITSKNHTTTWYTTSMDLTLQRHGQRRCDSLKSTLQKPTFASGDKRYFCGVVCQVSGEFLQGVSMTTRFGLLNIEHGSSLVSPTGGRMTTCETASVDCGGTSCEATCESCLGCECSSGSKSVTTNFFERGEDVLFSNF